LVSIALVARGGDFYDDRVDPALPLAPAVRIIDLLGAGTRQSAVPMLIIGGLEDQTTAYEGEQVFGYDSAPPPKGLVGIHGAGHFSFTELCAIDLGALADELDLDIDNVIEDGCGPGFIPADTMNRIERYFAASYFNYVLRQSRRAGRDLSLARLPADIAWNVDYVEEGLAP
jgi:predicted dienelactone hydrolase